MGDPLLDRISERFSDRRPLRACLERIPGMTDRKVRRLIECRQKNGLGEIATKATDGMFYVFVEDFMEWVDRGMKPAA